MVNKDGYIKDTVDSESNEQRIIIIDDESFGERKRSNLLRRVIERKLTFFDRWVVLNQMTEIKSLLFCIEDMEFQRARPHRE